MDLEALRNDRGQIWLNVASSRQFLPGLVNLDHSPFLRLLPVARLIRPIRSRATASSSMRFARRAPGSP